MKFLIPLIFILPCTGWAAPVVQDVQILESRNAPIQMAGLFGKRNKKVRQRGNSVCGDRQIIGKPVAPISNGPCGIKNPVRITSVAGVALQNGATLNCATAQALQKWMDTAAVPALKRKGGGLVSVRVAASYSCRTRNSRKGAKLSEHAKGNGVDISSFTLKSGETLTVLKDWRGKNSSVMKKMHKKACGTFGTVLGPNADAYHQDHFHFDTARHRNGSYCR
ncbi:hypothetical protein GCM10007939_23720 [Amylibacter marinus]|uniref:Extensin-like C-terminal domain-containing protein n=1 Tax=Amylibacter marinus TaxID=1475483 RepID=A0ABQ5VYC0_9RHOB|nr:extensin family protein [Amylibacter marinus]GLQ36088.1 hypothetical protein GCM10007939_23720 [Amylibacter marinus]